MNEYKIEVANEAESKEVQELFFELGYSWIIGGKSLSHLNSIYLFTEKTGSITFADSSKEFFNEHTNQQITLPELRILALLKRNDVSDATHVSEYGHKWLISGDNYYFYDCDEWLETSLAEVHYYGVKPIQKKEKDMSNLISGKEAKLAWANGQEVQEVQEKDKFSNVWRLINGEQHLKIFDSECLDFRLKPQKITVTLELPKPFKPKIDDEYWYVSAGYTVGYASTKYKGDWEDEVLIQFGAYRIEEEVKQVVEALRAAALEALNV